MKKDLPWYEGMYIVKALGWGAIGDCSLLKYKLMSLYGTTTIKNVRILHLNCEELLMQDEQGAYILLPMRVVLSIAPMKGGKKDEKGQECDTGSNRSEEQED